MFLDRPHQLRHFVIVLHLERVIPERMERMELRQLQINRLALINGTGEAPSWAALSALAGRPLRGFAVPGSDCSVFSSFGGRPPMALS